MLRVRDPRISAKSMLTLCRYGHSSLNDSALEKIKTISSNHDAHPWERAAELLGIPAEQVQRFICKGRLKVRDPFVTDRSFEEFCRKHGDHINMSLIDPATAKWLRDGRRRSQQQWPGDFSRAEACAGDQDV